MLLGQVQSIALTSQFNVDMPEAYTSFTTGFGWANLQLDLLGRWDPVGAPLPPPHNATANASATGRRRRRLADESARSEECASSSEAGGNTATAARNATKEIGRDGTSAYLGGLHTSAERFFLNNMVRE